jgi:hypothetical protein
LEKCGKNRENNQMNKVFPSALRLKNSNTGGGRANGLSVIPRRFQEKQPLDFSPVRLYSGSFFT